MFDKEILKSKINSLNPGPAMEYLNSTMSSQELYDYLENYIKNIKDEIVYLPSSLKYVIFSHIIELECDMPYIISTDENMVDELIISDIYDSCYIKLFNFYKKIIKKYNKKNKFYIYNGYIYDYKYEYFIVPKDCHILSATIDNDINVSYDMTYFKEFDFPIIKIFGKEV